MNEDALIAAVNESAEQGISFLSNLLGLYTSGGLGGGAADSGTNGTDATPPSSPSAASNATDARANTT